MKTLTVRNLAEDVYEQFTERAREQQRNAEAHARHLIEREAFGTAETCGELLDWIEGQPAPEVNDSLLATFASQRGRRSNRP